MEPPIACTVRIATPSPDKAGLAGTNFCKIRRVFSEPTLYPERILRTALETLSGRQDRLPLTSQPLEGLWLVKVYPCLMPPACLRALAMRLAFTNLMSLHFFMDAQDKSLPCASSRSVNLFTCMHGESVCMQFKLNFSAHGISTGTETS